MSSIDRLPNGVFTIKVTRILHKDIVIRSKLGADPIKLNEDKLCFFFPDYKWQRIKENGVHT